MLGVMKVGRGPGLVEIREVPEPVPGPGEVLIEVAAAAICGSDLHIYHDEHPYWPPVVLGHEFAGTIVAVGPGVAGYAAGDRVVSETSTGSCGVCSLCRTGNRHICPHKRPPGIGRDGAFTKYVRMPADLLHRIPEGISFEEAALAEPIAIAVHATLERAAVRPGERVLITGPGPIGLLCLEVARAAGAGTIIVTGAGRDAALRLPAARRLGADLVINVAEEDVTAQVMDVTGGEGVDVAIETSGAPPALASLPALVRRLGRICQVGITGRPDVAFPADTALFRGIDLSFSFSSRHSSWVTGLRLLGAGRLPVGPLLSLQLPLRRWQEAFEAQEQGRAIKALLLPGRSDG